MIKNLKTMRRLLVELKNEDIIKCWDEIIEEGTYEYIISIPTSYSKIKLLIYTSINIDTESTRGYGKDRIRLVYQYKDVHSELYLKVVSLNRNDTIYARLQHAIKKEMNRQNLPSDFSKWHIKKAI